MLILIQFRHLAEKMYFLNGKIRVVYLWFFMVSLPFRRQKERVVLWGFGFVFAPAFARLSPNSEIPRCRMAALFLQTLQ